MEEESQAKRAIPVTRGTGEKLLIEDEATAVRHRMQRGEQEPEIKGGAGYRNMHVDIGGVADYGPVDCERERRCSIDK